MSERYVETVPHRHDGLQIDEHKTFARRHWTIERFAWAGFVLFVVAAAAGLTGGGGSQSRQVAVTGAARLDLPAVSRWQAADSLTVDFDATQPSHAVLLGPELLDLFAIEAILPEPARHSFGAEGLALEVAAPEGRLVLSLRARRPGMARYRVTVDGTAASGRALVLP